MEKKFNPDNTEFQVWCCDVWEKEIQPKITAYKEEHRGEEPSKFKVFCWGMESYAIHYKECKD